ncbi:hypothetical protein GOBAR_AA06368 [Gossypium barbadense]|uniref:Uncharacterized protein n=1 Tax=Gossypium barbadense TaxID=3634 RepID=A0A2P5YF45_GOSBA|nr:hypothetical protein GOBAR_AA06368 [Gossypium barbadense]
MGDVQCCLLRLNFVASVSSDLTSTIFFSGAAQGVLSAGPFNRKEPGNEIRAMCCYSFLPVYTSGGRRQNGTGVSGGVARSRAPALSLGGSGRWPPAHPLLPGEKESQGASSSEIGSPLRALPSRFSSDKARRAGEPGYPPAANLRA